MGGRVILITESGVVPSAVKRAIPSSMKAGFTAMGEYWIRRLLRKHFEPGAFQEYKYIPRSGQKLKGTKYYRRSYTGVKKKRMGHTLPLVFSGETRKRAQGSRVVSTSKYGRVVINAPTLNRRNKYSNINMREEITTISDRELPELIAAFRKAFLENAERFPHRRKQKVS